MKVKVFLEYVKVRVWKVAFYPSSTIPYVDSLAVGPFGGLKYDEVDLDEEDEEDDEDTFSFTSPSNQKNHIYSQAYFDSFDDNVATRLLTANSPSHLSKPLRKNDRNLDFNTGFDSPSDSKSRSKTKPISLRKLFTVKYCVCYLLDEHATVRQASFASYCDDILFGRLHGCQTYSSVLISAPFASFSLFSPPQYPLTFMFIFMLCFIYLSIYLSTYLPTYLPTSLPTYLRAQLCLPTARSCCCTPTWTSLRCPAPSRAWVCS